MKMYLVMYYNGERYENTDSYAIGVFSTGDLAEAHGFGYTTSKKEYHTDCSYVVLEITLDEGWCP